jgi:acyl-CoA thioesterase
MSLVEIENRGINDELFNILCNRWDSTPTHKTLGMRLTYLGQGTAGVKLTAGQEYTTVRGRLHGGISAMLADDAMGWAVITLGQTCVTLDMYVNYIAPAFGDNELIAEANVIHAGKKTVVTEATLYTDKGELVAKSRGTFSLKTRNVQEFE